MILTADGDRTDVATDDAKVFGDLSLTWPDFITLGDFLTVLLIGDGDRPLQISLGVVGVLDLACTFNLCCVSRCFLLWSKCTLLKLGLLSYCCVN